MGSETLNMANVALGVLGLLVQMIMLVVGGVWTLHKFETRMGEKMNAIQKDVHSAVEDGRQTFDEKLADLSRQTGDAATVLRQKITEVELYARDTFIRRETFFEIMRRSEKVIETQFANLGLMIGKLETRLEKLVERADLGRSSGDN